MPIKKKFHAVLFKFIQDCLLRLVEKHDKNESIQLLSPLLKLLAAIALSSKDFFTENGIKLFETWACLLYFNFSYDIFNEADYQQSLSEILESTPIFFSSKVLPRKSPLIINSIADIAISTRFSTFLKESAKYYLDDFRGHFVANLDSDELILLCLVYFTQVLKFHNELSDDLASYLYNYYIKSSGKITFDIIFRLCQKVSTLDIFVIYAQNICVGTDRQYFQDFGYLCQKANYFPLPFARAG